jgi:hypothetical protein
VLSALRGVRVDPATGGRTKSEDRATLERAVERANVRLAYQRVVRNQWAAGVDGVTVAEFRDWLVAHWPSVKQARAYTGEGKCWVEDVDLEKFVDRLNHDVLMTRVSRGVRDERVLKLAAGSWRRG